MCETLLHRSPFNLRSSFAFDNPWRARRRRGSELRARSLMSCWGFILRERERGPSPKSFKILNCGKFWKFGNFERMWYSDVCEWCVCEKKLLFGCGVRWKGEKNFHILLIIACKLFHRICSFVTYNEIFMTPLFKIGEHFEFDEDEERKNVTM